VKITKTHDGKIVIDGESNVLVVNPPSCHGIVVENMESGEHIYVRNFTVVCKNKRYNLRNKIKIG
jgi:hypothetical protein